MMDLLEGLNQLGTPRVMVLGDLILDRCTQGTVTRVCPEAPVGILRVNREEAGPGGAAAVAVLLRGLGAEVEAAGAVGDDSPGRVLRCLLQSVDINTRAVLTVPGRTTTIKQRLLGQVESGPAQQLLRVDQEQTDPLPPEQERLLLQAVARRLLDCAALLISDYAKGVCSPQLLSAVIPLAQEYGIPVLVDPARTADVARYRQADLLTPNRAEAELASGVPITSGQNAVIAGHRILERAGVPAVLLKLDRDGMALVRHDGPALLLPAPCSRPLDVTGAGDMVLAVLGLCRAAGWDWEAAVRLANVAAGVQVQRQGVASISRAELRHALTRQGPRSAGKIVDLEALLQLAWSHREQGKSIVFTNGCFDLLHTGHVHCLEEAAALGDVLVVALNSDRGVRRLKGPERPLIAQQDRARLVAALECVAHVLVFDDDTPHELLRQLRPDVLVKGAPYRAEEVVGREVVAAYGGKVCVTSPLEGRSTTQILAAVRDSNRCA
jgi:D-beta-D-heptose 7-phosphate kinase/D-beta-D-heptose 1-phosphate adenosyltransferase